VATIAANPTAAPETTVRGPSGVPWKTVMALATALAFADGYWLVSLQGATGAFGRTDHPFATWLRMSTVLLPVFAFAVLGALTIALRWYGQQPDKTRAAVATAVLVVTTGTAVGLAALVANTAYDYHVQSAQLQQVQGMISMHGRCDSGCLAQEKRGTLAVEVRGLLLVSRWLLLTNLGIVAWLVAIMGGRVRLSTVARREGLPGGTDPVSKGSRAQLRDLLVGTLVAGAAIHAAVVPEHLTEWKAAGLFFILLTVGELTVAGLVVWRVRRIALDAAVVISIGPLLLWLYSRTAGMPFGPEPGVPESIGVPDCLACAVEIVSLFAALILLRPPRWLPRRPPVSAHGYGLAALALISAITIGVAATGLSWIDAFAVSSQSGPGM